MTQDLLLELIKTFEAGSIARLEYAEGDDRLVLEKTAPAAPAAPAVPVAAPVVSAPAAPAPAAAAPAGPAIKAPLVGTFYAAAQPGAEPFVKPGDTVHKGQTVCIIEAMKMINEVPAPCDCVIEESLVEDGALAGFGDELFRIREL